MTMVRRTVLVSSLLFLLVSCITGKQNVTHKLSHNNVVERIVRDSIYVHDSVSVVYRADTVYLERVRLLYRDKMSVDTFLLCDTVYNERVVTVEKKVARSYSLHYWLLSLFFLYILAKGLPGKLWRFIKQL